MVENKTRKKKGFKLSTSKETGRISALKVGRYLEKEKSFRYVYFPQFEIIEYKHNSGDVIKSTFCCISDLNNESGLAEFNDEMDALKFAFDYRNKLEF